MHHDVFGSSMLAGLMGMFAGSVLGGVYLGLGFPVMFTIMFITLSIINARVEIARLNAKRALTDQKETTS